MLSEPAMEAIVDAVRNGWTVQIEPRYDGGEEPGIGVRVFRKREFAQGCGLNADQLAALLSRLPPDSERAMRGQTITEDDAEVSAE